MNDLLQRMLAIDQEAEKLVQEADTVAAKILQDTRLQISKDREEAQATLIAECDSMLLEQIAKGKEKADLELKNADLELDSRQKIFVERISRLKPEILRHLLLPS
ncbi:MAG: hypothetical protein WCT05_09035 [Lentisphaeria bacterium]